MSFNLRLRDFAYDTEFFDRPPESQLSYHPGGFHPVTLGTIISSAKTRYHLVQKLGWGGFATVWLVQDLSSLDWLALRIRRSQYASGGEGEVLDRLRSMQSRSPHLPIIFDVFTIDGPNGKHEAIVTDLVAPLDAALSKIPPERVDLKATVRGLVEAVAHMHDAGIVHGDLHIGNVGFALTMRDLKPESGPFLPSQCPITAPPDVTLVIPQTPEAMALSSHFPPYLVHPIDIGQHYEKLRDVSKSHLVKLFDFGNACLAEKPRPTICFMSSIAPPEWEIGQTLEQRPDDIPNKASDIWALGLLIFTVMSGGRSLFFSYGDQLLEMVRLAGAVPSEWNTDPAINALNTSNITRKSADNLWRQHRASLRTACSSDEDVDALIALLRKILVLDPAARPSATDILRDPWFTMIRKSGHPGTSAQGISPSYPHRAPPHGPYPLQETYGLPQPAAYPGHYGTFHPRPTVPPFPAYGLPLHPHLYSYPFAAPQFIPHAP